MSSQEPATFEHFSWEGGEDGDAHYSKLLAPSFLWDVLDPVKDKIAATIGK